MQIVLADAGVPFNGLSPGLGPLGGAESAVVALAEALTAMGADVTAYTRTKSAVVHEGVRWLPLDSAAVANGDLLIANRDPRLIGRFPARRRVFWLHNPAGFLKKPRYLWPLLRHRPTVVFAGPHHRATAPGWLPLRAALIPLGTEPLFLTTPRAAPIPPPRLVFTSNPTRGLVPLAQLFASLIRPQVPGAELHVFAGAQVYGADGARAAAMSAALATAAALPGVVIRGPQPKRDLAAELAQARLMLYLGDVGETFCLALAEAQAMGVPCVVRPVGAVGERVREGETGFIRSTDADLADAAVALLRNDALWQHFSQNALNLRPRAGWAQAAQRFAALA